MGEEGQITGTAVISGQSRGLALFVIEAGEPANLLTLIVVNRCLSAPKNPDQRYWRPLFEQAVAQKIEDQVEFVSIG